MVRWSLFLWKTGVQQRNATELLTDIVLHSGLAQQYLQGTENLILESSSRRAVERCLQIVGEAMTQLLALDSEYVRLLSDVRRIIAFRHLLTHHYYRVSPVFLREITTRSLPLLQDEVRHLLQLRSLTEDESPSE